MTAVIMATPQWCEQLHVVWIYNSSSFWMLGSFSSKDVISLPNVPTTRHKGTHMSLLCFFDFNLCPVLAGSCRNIREEE